MPVGFKCRSKRLPAQRERSQQREDIEHRKEKRSSHYVMVTEGKSRTATPSLKSLSKSSWVFFFQLKVPTILDHATVMSCKDFCFFQRYHLTVQQDQGKIHKFLGQVCSKSSENSFLFFAKGNRSYKSSSWTASEIRCLWPSVLLCSRKTKHSLNPKPKMDIKCWGNSAALRVHLRFKPTTAVSSYSIQNHSVVLFWAMACKCGAVIN